MSDHSAATLLLLLRLRAFASPEEIGGALGLSPAAVDVEVRRCESRGWVQHRNGLAAGWSLTPEGRRQGQELLRAEVEAAGVLSRIERSYERFLPLNTELLSVCTDWQTVVVGGMHMPNDHSDASRDAAVLTRLDSLHRAARPVLDALAEASDRFATYSPRLGRAHGAVREGRTEWLAKPTIDSYHGVWFELHEHLLVTLGRDRTGERLSRTAPSPNGDNG